MWKTFKQNESVDTTQALHLNGKCSGIFRVPTNNLIALSSGMLNYLSRDRDTGCGTSGLLNGNAYDCDWEPGAIDEGKIAEHRGNVRV